MFSSFRVERDGRPVNGGLSGKARQLLKILAAHRRRPVPRDALIEMLRPDADPRAGAISLKVVAHRLRTALDPDRRLGEANAWISAEHGTYRLNPNAPIWVDAEVFRQRYDRGRQLEARGELQEARREFMRAEELYAGDYLEEDIYDDWTVLLREELHDIYLDLLQRLALLSLKSEAYHDVIRCCHKIVLSDPCREDAYRLLMQSHAALNQVARAGAWYAVCRATLAREVAAEPARETVETFEQLFRQAPAAVANGIDLRRVNAAQIA